LGFVFFCNIVDDVIQLRGCGTVWRGSGCEVGSCFCARFNVHLNKTLGFLMTIVTATQARSDIYNLIRYVNVSHDEVAITSKNGNAYLISEEDFNVMKEMAHLHSVPGLVEDIKAGMKEPFSKCVSRKDIGL